MEWPLAACLKDLLQRPSVRVWQWTRNENGAYIWRELSPEEFYAHPSDDDFVVIDEYESYSRKTDFIVEMKPKPKKLKPVKAWIAMNNKPAWLKGKR